MSTIEPPLAAGSARTSRSAVPRSSPASSQRTTGNPARRAGAGAGAALADVFELFESLLGFDLIQATQARNGLSQQPFFAALDGQLIVMIGDFSRGLLPGGRSFQAFRRPFRLRGHITLG